MKYSSLNIRFSEVF